MKKLLLLICAVLISACASAPKRQNADFSGTFDKLWKLSEVRSTGGKIIFDANKFDDTFSKDTYTIQFNAQQASGVAAPNRYRMPYALTENGITFKPAAATMMMALKEPPLKEREYFNLLAKVYKWELKKSSLLLYTLDAQNNKIIMIFR